MRNSPCCTLTTSHNSSMLGISRNSKMLRPVRQPANIYSAHQRENKLCWTINLIFSIKFSRFARISWSTIPIILHSTNNSWISCHSRRMKHSRSKLWIASSLWIYLIFRRIFWRHCKTCQSFRESSSRHSIMTASWMPQIK